MVPVISCVVLISLFSLASAGAQTDAMATVAAVDPDFAVQGEYAGTVLMGGCRCAVGLQVVALGAGKFQAVMYDGGLPGAGWYRGLSQRHLKGERTDAVVTLVGESSGIAVADGVATVTDRDGHVAGTLAKVERISPTLGQAAPDGATVLFDGSHTDHFQKGRMTDDGLLMVGTQLRQSFASYHLHVEFRLPYMPSARGQGRGNSGVYLQSRYEVQILDSFGLDGKDNECGALYHLRPPDVNMCFPPLTWQTYDIRFQPARFDRCGDKRRHARLTVWHNGVAIHDDVCITRKTGAGAEEGPGPLPIKFQDHGNPVHFRNLWIVEYADRPDFPLLADLGGLFRLDHAGTSGSGRGFLSDFLDPLRCPQRRGQ